MLAEGNHSWNGGIFLFRADIYLGALAVYAPDMLAAAQAAMAQKEIAGAAHEGTRILPDAQSFAACPADSIDYAVMEKAPNSGRPRRGGARQHGLVRRRQLGRAL